MNDLGILGGQVLDDSWGRVAFPVDLGDGFATIGDDLSFHALDVEQVARLGKLEGIGSRERIVVAPDDVTGYVESVESEDAVAEGESSTQILVRRIVKVSGKKDEGWALFLCVSNEIVEGSVGARLDGGPNSGGCALHDALARCAKVKVGSVKERVAHGTRSECT
jgi:hypothetical protein